MTELILRNRIILDAGIIDHPYWQGARITYMLNENQRWLQLELLKQTITPIWKDEANLSFSANTHQNIAVAVAQLPSDMLWDVPPISIVVNTENAKPVSLVDDNDFVRRVGNIFMKPTTLDPIGFYLMSIISDPAIVKVLAVYPSTGVTSGKLFYHRLITDLVYDDDTLDSEIPFEHQEKLIEKTVADIKAINTMDEKTRQARVMKIEQEVGKRYQMKRLAPESESPTQDKEVIG